MSESHRPPPRGSQRSAAWIEKAAGAVVVLALAGVAFAGGVNYTYDALGRLATVVYDNGTTTTTITYSYDAAGNRTSVATTSP